jgi:hypothetical protein
MSNTTRHFQEDTHALCVLALARHFVSGVSVILPTQKKQCLGEIQLSIVSFSNTQSMTSVKGHSEYKRKKPLNEGRDPKMFTSFIPSTF